MSSKEVAAQRAEDLVRETEASKAHVHDVSCRPKAIDVIHRGLQCIRDELSAFNNNVDDNYLLVASHVDEMTKQKITVMNI